MFMVSRRRPAIVLHFPWGRLIAPGTWPFLKSLASRTSMMATSSLFSIWWLISTGPVVKAILSAKNCFALAALLLIALVILLVCFWFWGNLCRSRHKKLGEDLVALPGQGEIFFGDSAGIMRGELQRHLVKTNINIRMVIDFLSFPGDPVDKINALQESLKLKCPQNCLSAFRPVRDGF